MRKGTSGLELFLFGVALSIWFFPVLPYILYGELSWLWLALMGCFLFWSLHMIIYGEDEDGF